MLRFVVLAMLVGCASGSATLRARSLSQLPDPREVLLGDDIMVGGDAERCSRHWEDGEDDPKNIFAGLPDYRKSCSNVAADVELSCTAPCAIHDGRVTPTRPGPVDVISTLRGRDGHVLATSRDSYVVVVADGLGMSCGTSDTPASCGDIPASMAFVRPYVTVHGQTTTAQGVTINGRPAKRYGATALAELFPERATDGRVEPGVYTLEVHLGDNHVRRDVTVR